ncbi:MAG: maleylpyruvate isomerase family mycothiol-dependent enzyme [Dehalococcoidia bacterium]|nr:maleylpyruvate isomerase family mycothiol-dependent enzyme [Dehalococcoidia bacterium]
MTTSDPQGMIDVINSSSRRLGDYLSGLDPQAWSQDSACEGWKVGDVVAHLTVGGESWSGSLTRALAGDADPPPGQSFLPQGELGSQVIGQAAIDRYQESGTELLQEYLAAYERLDGVLSTLGAGDWDGPCYHRRGRMPVRDFVGVRLQELALHSWDIRAGADPAAEMWEEPLPRLVSILPRWLRIGFRRGLGLPAPARFRFDVSGPAPVNEDVVVNDDAFQVEPAGDAQADAVFRCNSGNYILLIYGRLSVAQGIASGRLQVGGSPERAADFTRWFQGF